METINKGHSHRPVTIDGEPGKKHEIEQDEIAKNKMKNPRTKNREKKTYYNSFFLPCC